MIESTPQFLNYSIVIFSNKFYYGATISIIKKRGDAMPLDANKVISFNYTLKDDQGAVIESTSNKQPLTFLSGQNQIIPKLEEALNGMLIGGKKNVKVDAVDAYGEYSADAIQSVKKEQFPAEAKLEVGMTYLANSPDGKQVPFTIKEVKETEVMVDFNHPLAGKNLEFDVELLDVRDATPEEISHGHVHGPGGHHH